jgi:hypothetical protein
MADTEGTGDPVLIDLLHPPIDRDIHRLGQRFDRVCQGIDINRAVDDVLSFFT